MANHNQRARGANAKPQLLNYLRAADLSLGLVIHFAPTGAVIKRVVASPEYRSRWK